MTSAELIRNAALVEDVFGEWPSFHDAEVISVRLDRRGSDAPTLEMDVYVFERTAEVDAEGMYVLKSHTLVTFRFLGVALERLEGFNEGNVLWDLSIREVGPAATDGRRLEVQMDSSYGLEALFRCAAAEVLAVSPHHPGVR